MEGNTMKVSKAIVRMATPHTSRHRQRGLSFFGVVFVGAILVFGFVVGAQVVPTVVEFQNIKNGVNRAKTEATVDGIRKRFDDSANIDNITSITGKDLKVSKRGDKTVVEFAYERDIHLVGPAFLVLRYSGSSD
jgi:hypothetical protein